MTTQTPLDRCCPGWRSRRMMAPGHSQHERSGGFRQTLPMNSPVAWLGSVDGLFTEDYQNLLLDRSDLVRYKIEHDRLLVGTLHVATSWTGPRLAQIVQLRSLQVITETPSKQTSRNSAALSLGAAPQNDACQGPHIKGQTQSVLPNEICFYPKTKDKQITQARYLYALVNNSHCYYLLKLFLLIS